MPRNMPKGQSEFLLVDVLYEDGALTSNRKVPSALLGGLEGDAPLRDFIEDQDREIAARSGRTRSRIKSVTRAGKRSRGK
jgi:hypothetical protein